MLAAICYPHTHLSEEQILDKVRRLPAEDRVALDARVRRRAHQPAAQAGPRVRTHRVPLRRARRLRRVPRPAASPHADDRMAEPVTSTRVRVAGRSGRRRRVAARFDDALERSAALHDVLATDFPEQAAYAVSLAYRMRYVMQMNAREAMHLCELRSSPQGHPSYRRIAAGDAHLHRRAGRPPRDRERDVVRRPRDVRPRTPVGRARRGGPARRTRLTKSDRGTCRRREKNRCDRDLHRRASRPWSEGRNRARDRLTGAAI